MTKSYVPSTCTNMVGHIYRRFDRNGKMRKNGKLRSCLTCAWVPAKKCFVYELPQEKRADV